MQGSVAMTDQFYGKCFSKRTGSENGDFRLGRDNVIIHRLRESYGNPGALHRSSLATEARSSVIAGTFAHAMLDLRTNYQMSQIRRRLWRHVESKVEEVQSRCGELMYHTLTRAGSFTACWISCPDMERETIKAIATSDMPRLSCFASRR